MSRSAMTFDENLLSGYLDGSLGHRDMQRVRIRLEEDPEARRLLEELRLMREAALTTRFQPPGDEEWPEVPRTAAGRFSRSLGWLLLGGWAVVVTVLALWRLLSQTGDPLEVFLVLGLPGGFVLLFVSVLLDRLESLKTDRYRGVQR